MVKHCSHGTCKSDSRYPDKLGGAIFIPFVKPRTDLAKCLRWITLCRRPHKQLNVEKITKYTYICSKHFISLDGPTEEYPDPCDAITGELRPARRRIQYANATPIQSCNGHVYSLETPLQQDSDAFENEHTESENGVACQTEETLFSSMEMLVYIVRNRQLEEENDMLKKDNARLTLELDAIIRKTTKHNTSKSTQTNSNFEFNTVSTSQSKINKLFVFYTGLTYSRFLMLLAFLFPIPNINPITYDAPRKETQINRFPLSEQVFMYLCRLRNGLNLKDLAFRFNVKVQTVSTVINSVAKYMYVRLGSLSYWPHRSVIIDNMTSAYKKDFPTCLAILDCTELKTEKPSSLKQQSQCYSDYKSTNTLKALVVCDSRGSVIFVSDLFAGSISDNEIVRQCGFIEFLAKLKEIGHVHAKDSVMADKGFLIDKDLAEIDIGINIPPFASSARPFSEAEVALTKKIASHRIHIERSINQIKCFKLLKRIIPISMFEHINAHWFNATILTNFQDTLVKKIE